MKATSIISLFIKAALAVTVAIVAVSMLFGQDKAGKGEYKAKYKEFCSSNNYSGDGHVSFRDLREMTLPSTGSLTVDAGRNGGIVVRGSDRSDVLVRACVQSWGNTEEEAKAVVSDVKIATSPAIKADGANEEKWSVSYEILAPRSTDLKLNAHNGGIVISSVDGRLEFETQNGGVILTDVAGDVHGRTTNGGVVVSLSGTSWKGSGLDVQTTNGGVHISLPETYAANVETGTVNGDFSSNIPALNITTEDVKGDEWNHSRSKKISTAINGGGAPLRISTTNGGVVIRAAGTEKKY
jgi:DUF4097 and DUF4098 domain-containing protein YvlB